MGRNLQQVPTLLWATTVEDGTQFGRSESRLKGQQSAAVLGHVEGVKITKSIASFNW